MRSNGARRTIALLTVLCLGLGACVTRGEVHCTLIDGLWECTTAGGGSTPA